MFTDKENTQECSGMSVKLPALALFAYSEGVSRLSTLEVLPPLLCYSVGTMVFSLLFFPLALR